MTIRSRRTIVILITALTVLPCRNGYPQQSVMRGRNEGTLFIPASNVMGNGNITVSADLGGLLSSRALNAVAQVKADLGIAGIMQFNLQTSFINFTRFGMTQAHLQITLPDNDRLRFFGMALVGDLYLSTTLDTISATADQTKPEYAPYPLFSTIVDFDWLARPQQLPLKTYLSFGLAENAVFLFQYHQLALRAGVEMKKYEHSLFFDIGAGFFKNKHQVSNKAAGYDQRHVWISPGARYRIRKRFSLLAHFKCTIYRDIDERMKNNSLELLDWLSLNIKIEAPLIYRETDTEAIRTMVFIEKIKSEQESAQFIQGTDFQKELNTTFEKTLSDLEDEEETFDYKRERDELIQRREKVESVMEKIESLLKEDAE